MRYQQLRARLRGWLEQALPEKTLREPPTLQEAETTSGQLLRGFFKEVRDAQGNLVGYKRYSTYEQSLDPVAEVGTYRLEEFKVAPGPSTLARCVRRYRDARKRLLDQPGRQELWVEFAALCEALHAEVRAYRTRAPAGVDLLSFEQEAKFARTMLAPDNWTAIQKIAGS